MEEKKEKTELEKHFSAVRDKIKRFLPKESPSDVLIIKSHLICEYYLNQILLLKEVCLAKEISKLSFYEKCGRALDKTQKDEARCYETLIKLNKLRNKVGHELEYVLSEADVDGLGFVLGKDYILEKYDHPDLPELLWNTLLPIVIETSFVLYKIVDAQKKIEKKKS